MKAERAMTRKITITQKFEAPVNVVFDFLSKHASYNQVFWPIQVVRTKDSADPQRPDGLGSQRKMGLGPIKPITEEITLVQENEVLEYKLINNPLIRHHHGRLEFKAISDTSTLVTYSIELDGKLPLSSFIILSQLKVAITIGLAKAAKSLKK